MGPLGFLALLALLRYAVRRRERKAEVAEVVREESRREALWRRAMQGEREAAEGGAVEVEAMPQKEYTMTAPSRARVAPISPDTIFF